MSDCQVAEKDLDFLQQHYISELRLCKNRSLNLSRLISKSLNDTSRKCTLQLLDLSGCLKGKCPGLDSVLHLTALRTLILSETPLTNGCLQLVCESLPCLDYLDICQTQVTDIEPLKHVKDRLRVLLMHDLRMANPRESAIILSEMDLLEVLDISIVPQVLENQVQKGAVASLLLAASVARNEGVGMPKLKIFEMAGLQEDVHRGLFVRFLKSHPSLTYLGLLKTDACWFPEVIALSTEARIRVRSIHGN